MSDFTCKKCNEDFKSEWNFGDEVTCPHCKTKFETDYEEDCDMNISGPWLTKEVTNQS